MNIFNDDLSRVDESRHLARAANNQLIVSVLEIGAAQKTHYLRQKTLSDYELEIAEMKLTNKNLRATLLKMLIERDELTTKRAAIRATNERLWLQKENLDRETNELLRGDEIDYICERFSISDQISILKEIQNARCKLIKFGFPLSFFA